MTNHTSIITDKTSILSYNTSIINDNMHIINNTACIIVMGRSHMRRLTNCNRLRETAAPLFGLRRWLEELTCVVYAWFPVGFRKDGRTKNKVVRSKNDDF